MGQWQENVSKSRSCRDAGEGVSTLSLTELHPGVGCTVPVTADSTVLLWTPGLCFPPCLWYDNGMAPESLVLTCSRRKPVQTRTCWFCPQEHRFQDHAGISPRGQSNSSTGSSFNWKNLRLERREGEVSVGLPPTSSLHWAVLGAHRLGTELT